MKINQYCSVCKKHLDMEVISTDDGGDDGVIWLRCPECQGFLPKFTGEGLGAGAADTTETADTDETTDTDEAAAKTPAGDPAAPTPRTASPPTTTPEPDRPTSPPPDGATVSDEDDGTEEPVEAAEPIAEYAAMLAEADLETARPYRPDVELAVGDVVHHLAQEDMGVVVALESLPGGRTVAKVFFEKTGVMRLIARAASGR